MNSVLFVATLLLLFDLSLAQLGCQGKTGLFAADPNGPSKSYFQCASGQLQNTFLNFMNFDEFSLL